MTKSAGNWKRCLKQPRICGCARCQALLRVHPGRHRRYIADALGISVRTILRWLHACQARGLAGLKMRWAPGRQAKIPEALAPRDAGVDYPRPHRLWPESGERDLAGAGDVSLSNQRPYGQRDDDADIPSMARGASPSANPAIPQSGSRRAGAGCPGAPDIKEKPRRGSSGR